MSSNEEDEKAIRAMKDAYKPQTDLKIIVWFAGIGLITGGIATYNVPISLIICGVLLLVTVLVSD
jgi:hypothetical protein